MRLQLLMATFSNYHSPNKRLSADNTKGFYTLFGILIILEVKQKYKIKFYGNKINAYSH